MKRPARSLQRVTPSTCLEKIPYSFGAYCGLVLGTFTRHRICDEVCFRRQHDSIISVHLKFAFTSRDQEHEKSLVVPSVGSLLSSH
jgi:hypothetical protein